MNEDARSRHPIVDIRAPDLHVPETLVSSVAGDEADATSRAPQSTRYDPRELLGSGGMGEVRLCRDRAIGREVAMKVMREKSDGKRGSDWRFVREARVQGQLEHPAIVPVYDIGLDAAGRSYFTMKRIHGMSLAAVISELAEDERRASPRWSQRRLLTLFAQLCRAVAYVHQRGVVHRDIKPSNVMLGEFGEIYLLDWGLAKISDDEPDAARPKQSTNIVDASNAQATLPGATLGTPGYMAPEQLRDDLGEIGPYSDVFALGLVLTEILTRQHVHEGRTVVQKIVDTLGGDGVSPSRLARSMTIAPELDRLVYACTRRRPSDRLASTLELAERIERYLDGDRDAELRATLAQKHADEARAALARATAAGADETKERTTAMREVGVALGLAPAHEDARRTLVTLLTSPPQTVPNEARERMKATLSEQRRVVMRGALVHYFISALYLPFIFWMGVRSWPALGAVIVSIAACAALAAERLWRGAEDDRLPLVHFAVSVVTVLLCSCFLGSLIVVPVLALGNLVGYFTAYTHRRSWVLVGCLTTLVLPLVLAQLGWIPAAYGEQNGVFTVLPFAVDLPAVPTVAYMLASQALMLIVGAVLLAMLRTAYERAQTAVEMQKWQLEQILPIARAD